MKHISVLLLVLFLAGCSKGTGDLVIVDKQIQRQALSQSVAGDEFGSAAGSTIENTVVGQIQNNGTEEARNVEVTFHVTGGGQNFALVAQIPSIPAGKSVSFRTRGVQSMYTLQFKDGGEAEITMGKQE